MVDIYVNVVHIVLNFCKFASRLLRNVGKYCILPLKFEYSLVPPSGV